MTTLDGIFHLRTPRDLREKLEADFARLSGASPSSQAAQYAAFDFFVCAEHLAEWQSHTTGSSVTSLRQYPDGPLVSHIANGAKHFTVKDKRHSTVSDTSVVFGGFQSNAFQSNAFASGASLVVELENGRVEDVLAVADRVRQHWRTVLP